MVLFDFGDISEYINVVKDFFTNIYDLFMIVLGFLPEPFNKIALGFVVVLIAVIIIKIIT